jgi:hypothetical protein
MSSYQQQITKLQDVIYKNDLDRDAAKYFKSNDNVTFGKQINIYRNNFYQTLSAVIDNVFPFLRQYLGNQAFENIRDQYVVTNFSNVNLNLYSVGFGEYIHNKINDQFAGDIAQIETAKIKVNWNWENRKSFINYYKHSDWPYDLQLRLSGNVVILKLNSLADNYIINNVMDFSDFSSRYVLIYKDAINILQQDDLHEVEYFMLSQLENGKYFSDVMDEISEKYKEMKEDELMAIVSNFIPKVLNADALVVEGEYVIL